MKSKKEIEIRLKKCEKALKMWESIYEEFEFKSHIKEINVLKWVLDEK